MPPGQFMRYGQFRVRCDDSLVEHVEDWSRVRSPGRARRRRARGYRQNIVAHYIPKQDIYKIGHDLLVMHSEMWRRLQRETAHEA